jgi:hypothetical protein
LACRGSSTYSNLVGDQQLIRVDLRDSSPGGNTQAAERFQHQHQIDCAEEMSLLTLLGSQIAECDVEVRLAYTLERNTTLSPRSMKTNSPA